MKFVVFGGGGKVARHFARIATNGGDEVVSVVRNEDYFADLKSLGARPHVLSIEDAPVTDLVSFLTGEHPDAVIFAAGAGGKGPKERTRKVDYEGAVKVYDAMEGANIKRLLLVGAIDTRDHSKPAPGYYNEESKESSEKTWKAIPACKLTGKCEGGLMEDLDAKLDAEIELHARKQLQFTVIRPGGLTDEAAGGVELGVTQLKKTSRELVAQVLLACAKEPRTEGLTIDALDGSASIEAELAKVVDKGLDSWQACTEASK